MTGNPAFRPGRSHQGDCFVASLLAMTRSASAVNTQFKSAFVLFAFSHQYKGRPEERMIVTIFPDVRSCQSQGFKPPLARFYILEEIFHQLYRGFFSYAPHAHHHASSARVLKGSSHAHSALTGHLSPHSCLTGA